MFTPFQRKRYCETGAFFDTYVRGQSPVALLKSAPGERPLTKTKTKNNSIRILKINRTKEGEQISPSAEVLTTFVLEVTIGEKDTINEKRSLEQRTFG